MPETLEELMRDYRSAYSDEVRDLAETFCGSTTRMSVAGDQPPKQLTAEFRERAQAHGIDVEILSQAVSQYTRIEALAEARLRRR